MSTSSLNPNKRKAEFEAGVLPKRSSGTELPNLRLNVENLMHEICADEELNAKLSQDDWDQLAELRSAYEAGTLDRRTLVDDMSNIVGGTMKLFRMVQTALSKSQCVNGANQAVPLAPTLPLRAALQRVSSIASSASSASTPGGAEVASILCPSRPASSHASSTARSTPTSPDIHALVHSFHCDDDECAKPKCSELKRVLTRMEGHVRQCPASRTPLGAPLSKECKTCRLWKALARTRNGSASAQPQGARSSLAVALR